jgi:hypothetical protein
MRIVRNFALGAALTVIVTGTAAAQRPAALEQGKHSISFGLPGNQVGTTFGVWTMFSDNLNLGLNLGLGVSSVSTEGTTTARTTSTSIAPALRYYTGSLGPVLPFLYGETSLSYSKTSQPVNRTLKGLGLAGGLGAEWFPVGNIGIAGYTGLALQSNWTTNNQGGSSTTANTLSIGTMTSGLSINLYFGGRGAAVAAQR